ncbi:LapA family protein [Metabacillus arenae]|uniref:DUF1049 domain-containing protein n=1 Tax=Metabacillus arenae TaxID=2771434 RepID=A0A926NHN8_9BACI|nr:lipopolysaccharide assembly protein LapA domain-containing protein [Metabacillus arenae]MBD1381235.1 DUF1049 domain-containing protein [Metabacillus arenae]
MKKQRSLLFAFIFIIIVAVFAVINVEPVQVDYLFGHSQWPLILVILGSAFLGGLIVSMTGIVQIFNLQRKIKTLQKEKTAVQGELNKVKVGHETNRTATEHQLTEKKGMGTDNTIEMK